MRYDYVAMKKIPGSMSIAPLTFGTDTRQAKECIKCIYGCRHPGYCERRREMCGGAKEAGVKLWRGSYE